MDTQNLASGACQAGYPKSIVHLRSIQRLLSRELFIWDGAAPVSAAAQPYRPVTLLAFSADLSERLGAQDDLRWCCLVLATALVFAIIWSVERLAAKYGRRGHAGLPA